MNWLLSIAAALSLSACRPAHLGSDRGTAYLNAFWNQRENRSEQPAAPLDADDASKVVSRHHSPRGAQQGAPATAPALGLAVPTVK